MPRKSIDRSWLKTRKQWLDMARREVRARLGEEPADLKTYRKQSHAALKAPWKISSRTDLVAEIEEASLVLGGDFHSHEAAQRAHLRLLRALSPERSVRLALECVHRSKQSVLDDWSMGNLTPEDLKGELEWDKNWEFSWEHYFPLLELARRRRWPVSALGSVATRSTGNGALAEYDQRVVEDIGRFQKENPKELVYVIVGELHLEPLAKLFHQKAVLAKKRSDRSKHGVVIHLDTERIYFQLCERSLEHSVDVIELLARKKDLFRRYISITSPPWVPWQSYLLHIDRALETGLGRSADDESFEMTDHVARWLALGADELGVEVRVDGLAVHLADDHRLWKRIQKGLRRSLKSLAISQLTRGRSFYLPEMGVGCLARPTVNHAAHLAGEYFQIAMSGRTRVLWKFPGDFQKVIWCEALAYFFSKIINHKRRADNLHDLREALSSVEPTSEGREVLKLALDQRMSELFFIHRGAKRTLRLRTPKNSVAWIEAGLLLGRMTGERLYHAYLNGFWTRGEIVDLFRYNVDRLDFKSVYDGLGLRLATELGTEVQVGRGRSESR